MFGLNALIAEENYQIVEKGLPDFGEHRIIERLRQVDAGNLRPERAGGGANTDMGIGPVSGSGGCHLIVSFAG